MARRLGAWDCPYCSKKKILGNVFDCPGCGRPRPRGIDFYEIPNAPLVTPEIAAQLGSGGPNWYCEHCDSGNKDNATNCWKCGAPRGKSPSHKVIDYKQGETPHSADEAKRGYQDGKSWVVPLTGKSEEKSEHDHKPHTNDFGAEQPIIAKVKHFMPSIDIESIKILGIVFALVIGLTILGFFTYQFFFNTHTETVSISGYHWTQNVVVEKYQVVRESSWTTHPSEAYNIVKDYRDTGRDEKVHDGWKTVTYMDTCYRTVSYMDTCSRSVYHPRTCTGSRSMGDGSFDTYTYECGSSETEYYSCSKTRQESYSCTKTREEELYHYENIYDWYFTYDIDKWVSVDNYPTSGEDHKPYYYIDFVLKNPYSGGEPQLGQQKQNEIPGDYSVTFYCEGNTKVGEDGYFTRSYPLEVWNLYDMDRNYEIEVNFFNSIITYPSP
jgi:hypothetical protein